jgi:Chaperone of endosialidase
MRPMANNESMLSKIMNLKPICYDFDKACAQFMSLPTNKQFGFTAQNVESVFPELVSLIHQPANEYSSPEFSKNGLDYKAVNYIQIIPILTQAIQEQQEQIIKLQKQVELLLKR